MKGSTRSVLRVSLILVVLMMAAEPAWAQDATRSAPSREEQTRKPAPPRRASFFGWEIEVHTGAQGSRASHGGLTLPAPGALFTTFTGTQSRLIRSWYFGDGAAFLNVNLTAGGFSQRIIALDPVLRPSAVGPGRANPFGVRLNRPLTLRLGFEFSFDLLGSFGLTGEARDAAERTRATFQSAFEGRLGTFTGRQVSSTLSITEGGRQWLGTGAVTMNLGQFGRMAPYVLAGAGLWASSGTAATIALAGDYRFVSASATPYRQTDALDVEYRTGSSFAMLLGAGLRFDLNDRSGLRFDLRGHFAPDPATVVVNWRPATIQGTPANSIQLSGGSAPIQISNGSLQNTLALLQTTPDLEVASANSMRQLLNFTVGYYYRFETTRAAPLSQAARAAQGPQLWQTNKKWEVDVHGGGAFGNQPSAGTAGSFPTGASFTAPTGQPSRYASTWMFGDGAVLINQIATGFGASISQTDRMSSLNPALIAASLTRSRTGAIGARVSRRLTPKLRAEFAVESTAGSLKFTEEALTRIEATRASFAPVWNGIIGTGAGLFQSPQVSASANITESARRWQTSLTGGLEFGFWNSPRIVAYANFGAGIIRGSSTLPEATLTGSVQFLLGGVAPLSERDVVRLHYETKSSAPVVVFGGGAKYFLSNRHGIRVDLRVHAGGNSVDTLVDATPSMTPGSPPFSISSFTNPSMYFSNTTANRGNFTGPAISRLRTFSGSGREVHTRITAGYFFRF